MNGKRLLLCSAKLKRLGWITLDGNPEHEPDIVATIPPLPAAVTAVQWQEIEWVHGINVFYPWEAEQVLKELYAVMAPGGKLVLEQPNIALAMTAALMQDSRLLTWVFGDPTFHDPQYLCKWGYAPQGLARDLQAIGFREVQHLPAQHHRPERDFRMEARK